MPEDVDFVDRSELMTFDEIVFLSTAFADLGVSKFRLTGGEPLLRKELPEIIKHLKTLTPTVGLTTNATRLSARLGQLLEAGLTTINISLDSLRAERFEKITRRKGHDTVLKAIDDAVLAGLRVKINVVTQQGVNDDEILDFVYLSQSRPIHIRFIEFMPFNGNSWNFQAVVSYQSILARVRAELPIERLNDDPNSTSKSWRVRGWPGTFAVITTITQPFCSTCDRLRLTSDGKLRNCLFATEEADLLSVVRSSASDQEKLATLQGLIIDSLSHKHRETAGLKFHDASKHEVEVPLQLSRRPMVSIGG